MYGQAELERLQQILFYRELNFSLKDIGEALAEQSDYHKDKYGFDLTGGQPVQADEMNEMARETIRY